MDIEKIRREKMPEDGKMAGWESLGDWGEFNDRLQAIYDMGQQMEDLGDGGEEQKAEMEKKLLEMEEGLMDGIEAPVWAEGLLVTKIPAEILERHRFLAELPKGVAVMGGMARSIAREMITGEREPIRDIDLVNILDEGGESWVSDEMLRELSRRYMPDDYNYGHGIQSEEIGRYFSTRDFTVNQCLVLGDELVVTEQAYDDFQENIIRPTEYERYEEDGVSSRIFMKALMMQTVVAQFSESIPLLEDCECYEYIDDFNVALTLNKAMNRGVETAQLFVGDLIEWGIVDEQYMGKPKGLAVDLVVDLGGRFRFRPIEDKKASERKRWLDKASLYDDESLALFERYPVRVPWLAQEMKDYFGEGEVRGEGEDEEVREQYFGRYDGRDYEEVMEAARKRMRGEA